MPRTASCSRTPPSSPRTSTPSSAPSGPMDQPRSPSPQVPTRRLSAASELPLLGLGVWQVPDGPGCVDAVRWALELGYRHIDTAQAYGNEASVGRALREG